MVTHIDAAKDVIKDAKHELNKRDCDPHLVNYMLRDLKIISDAKLSDLSWSMHKDGCTKNDVIGLILSLEKYINNVQNESKESYLKRIHELTDDIDDNYLLGYTEAILNLLDEFTNGRCFECPFSFEVDSPSPDSVYPEVDVKCRLEMCWIDKAKSIIKKEG